VSLAGKRPEWVERAAFKRAARTVSGWFHKEDTPASTQELQQARRQFEQDNERRSATYTNSRTGTRTQKSD